MAVPLSAHGLNFLVDKYHDKVYEGVSNVPSRIKRRGNHRRSDTDPNADPSGPYYDDRDNYYRDDRNRDRGDKRRDMSDDGHYGGDGTSGYGPVNDDYPYAAKPDRARSADARGYGPFDSQSYNPQSYGGQGAMRRDAYDDRYAPRDDGYYNERTRYKQIEYKDPPSRDRDDRDSRSRRSDEWESDEEEERRVARRERREQRERERSKSRGRESGEESDEENTNWKKWGATLAGSAVGAFAGRKVGKDKENWVPGAIGAVVGGLLAREAEKEFYKHKERRKEVRAVSSHR